MLYKIVYAEKAAAMGKGGLVFKSQMEADDYVKKANQESPSFHYWFEPMPEPDEKLSAVQRQMLSRQADVSVR